MKKLKIPKNPGQRREWIKYMLRVNGSSFSAIANDLHVSRQAVRCALNNRYPKMEKAIADRIGMPPASIWPERYAA